VKILVIGVAFLSAVLTVLTRPDQHDGALALIAVGGITVVLVALTVGGVW
jgi:multisubunit Na+/H+ antiporter MnhF subunit